MVAGKLLVVLFSMSAVGCAHSPSTDFDRLITVVERRDRCIELLELHIKHSPDVPASSSQSIIRALVASMSGGLRTELARVAKQAYKREGAAELMVELRRRLSDVDVFRIKYCGAVAAEALPNILARSLSDGDRQFLSDQLGKDDMQDIEGFVFAVAALEAAGIEWDVSDFR